MEKPQVAVSAGVRLNVTDVPTQAAFPTAVDHSNTATGSPLYCLTCARAVHPSTVCGSPEPSSTGNTIDQVVPCSMSRLYLSAATGTSVRFRPHAEGRQLVADALPRVQMGQRVRPARRSCSEPRRHQAR